MCDQPILYENLWKEKMAAGKKQVTFRCPAKVAGYTSLFFNVSKQIYSLRPTPMLNLWMLKSSFLVGGCYRWPSRVIVCTIFEGMIEINSNLCVAWILKMFLLKVECKLIGRVNLNLFSVVSLHVKCKLRSSHKCKSLGCNIIIYCMQNRKKVLAFVYGIIETSRRSICIFFVCLLFIFGTGVNDLWHQIVSCVILVLILHDVSTVMFNLFLIQVQILEDALLDVKGTSLHSPKYNIHLHPVVSLRNLLPIPIYYTLQVRNHHFVVLFRIYHVLQLNQQQFMSSVTSCY